MSLFFSFSLFFFRFASFVPPFHFYHFLPTSLWHLAKKKKRKRKGWKKKTQTKTTQTTKKIFFQTILDSRFCLDIIYSRPKRREPALSDVTETRRRRRRRSAKGRLLSSSWGASSRVVWNVVSQLSSSHSSVFGGGLIVPAHNWKMTHVFVVDVLPAFKRRRRLPRGNPRRGERSSLLRGHRTTTRLRVSLGRYLTPENCFKSARAAFALFGLFCAFTSNRQL